MLQRAPWSSLRRSKRDDLLTSSIVHDAILARDLDTLIKIPLSVSLLSDRSVYRVKWRSCISFAEQLIVRPKLLTNN